MRNRTKLIVGWARFLYLLITLTHEVKSPIKIVILKVEKIGEIFIEHCETVTLSLCSLAMSLYGLAVRGK